MVRPMDVFNANNVFEDFKNKIEVKEYTARAVNIFTLKTLEKLRHQTMESVTLNELEGLLTVAELDLILAINKRLPRDVIEAMESRVDMCYNTMAAFYPEVFVEHNH